MNQQIAFTGSWAQAIDMLPQRLSVATGSSPIPLDLPHYGYEVNVAGVWTLGFPGYGTVRLYDPAINPQEQFGTGHRLPFVDPTLNQHLATSPTPWGGYATWRAEANLQAALTFSNSGGGTRGYQCRYRLPTQ